MRWDRKFNEYCSLIYYEHNFSVICFNLSAFHLLLHRVSRSPHHHHHELHLSYSSQPNTLALWAGIRRSYRATRPLPFPVLPSILCCGHRGADGGGTGPFSPHYPCGATGHCMGVSLITGWSSGHGIRLPWSSAACTGTSTVYCRYTRDTCWYCIKNGLICMFRDKTVLVIDRNAYTNMQSVYSVLQVRIMFLYLNLMENLPRSTVN